VLDDPFVRLVAVSANDDDSLPVINLVRVVSSRHDIARKSTLSKCGYKWTVVNPTSLFWMDI